VRPGLSAARESFVFGIPLIAQAAAHDWERVGTLLELTLRSVLGQRDSRFEVILAGHDRPACWGRLTRGDPRFRFLAADWDPASPTARNDDAGMKKWRIGRQVREAGGGLLMYLDADDLVDRRLVEAARTLIRPEHAGGVIGRGVIVDFATWRAAPVPHPRIFDGGFHELCGSSTIGRIAPESPDPMRRDPHEALGSHHVWPESAARIGVRLAALPVSGAYLVNTSQNHSERHGPHAGWRRALNAAVAREGRPFGGELATRFGLAPERVRRLRRAHCGPDGGGRRATGVAWRLA
jgi:hypothetical protein